MYQPNDNDLVIFVFSQLAGTYNYS